ncbi:hypothetical protein WJX74_007066 [Apatococcus lobatus]|uniref:PPM-type phosphatase domain-containing protein n=1 Tax=Apatococcus lobatus TaxID=904363 RepID=A0AAW1SGZ9_9CHLO
MASAYVPIQGPYIKHAFAKSVYKGEDFWLQQRDLQWTAEIKAGGTLEALGVFDGHGGKAAGQYTAKHLMPAVTSGLREGSSKMTAQREASEGLDLDGLQSDLAGGDIDAWQLQDAAVEQLPEALSHAFQRVQQDFFTSSKQSGTTATLVTLVGWDVFVANVGDSCAYLDTGSEVLQVSGNHRLDDAKAERERVEAAGSNVSQSNLDGKPVGPMRVWPGGLAMSRSIGDHEAGEAVISTPEVRHLVLPETGARIIIASDGLWDAINPKTAAHHVRGTPASKAAHDLMQAALKKRGMRDDITVIVIDACPTAEDRMPATLLSRKSSGSGSSHSIGSSDLAERVHVRKPLEEPWLAGRNEEVGHRRMAAAKAMLSQSDDLSSLSSSPWSSTISSLSDSSTFQMSSSLEATSSLAALAEEEDEDLASDSDHLNPNPDEPVPDVEELDEDGGWETVAKPSGRSAQAQDKLGAEASAGQVGVEVGAAGQITTQLSLPVRTATFEYCPGHRLARAITSRVFWETPIARLALRDSKAVEEEAVVGGNYGHLSLGIPPPSRPHLTCRRAFSLVARRKTALGSLTGIQEGDIRRGEADQTVTVEEVRHQPMIDELQIVE